MQGKQGHQPTKHLIAFDFMRLCNAQQDGRKDKSMKSALHEAVG